MSPIKVGVVGLSSTGWAASALAPGLLNAPSFSLTAVSTTSAASAEASAKKYSALAGHPVKSFHGDASGIANDKDVDLVAVSVKASAQKAVALAVIAAGKDVFIEWPAGANAQDTAEIAAAAKAKGVKSLVGLQGRQAPSIKKVKEILESGVIGKVRSSSIIALCASEINMWGPKISERSIYATDVNGGATWLNIGVGHLFDAVTYLLGDLTTVSATTAQHYPIVMVLDDEQKPTGKTVNASAPDQIAFNGLFKSGAISSAIFRAGLPATKGRKHFLWEIDGEEGSIRMESDELAAPFINVQDPKVYLNGELVEFEPVTSPATNLTSAWEAFAKGEAYPTLEDALKTRRLLEGIKQSAQEGRVVNL
ncbi:NAD(P)-binding protein [Athelia psychrophila]|uniref:NAD(P)-binding protein n=1 Tax=Athelia psychrophila TaxID=1759441 RepID=A0A166KMH3_9AGAM|nr:NAD(P)-binding protein [Fibularhizoctonia sp. CBS 109695]